MSLRKARSIPGAQHLDRDLLAGVGQPRAVDLRDRGGGDGLGEFAEQLGRPDPSSASIIALAVFGREGRQLVLQVFQLLGSSSPTMSGRVERTWPNLM
jgi:hypothetical protein